MAGTSSTGGGVRTPAEQLQALGSGRLPAPVEDSPRWHLGAAEEAMDEGRWDMARAAVQRARESIVAGSPEEDEAAFVALRLAVGTVDLRSATAEVMALAGRMDPRDPVWSGRVRRVIDNAPRVFPLSMRAGLLGLLPPLPDLEGRRAAAADGAIADVPVPAAGLPLLPGEEDWLMDVPADPSAAPPALAAGGLGPVDEVAEAPAQAAAEDVVAPREETAATGVFQGRVFVGGVGTDLTDADVLRDRLVEEMLARVTDEEGQVLFATATTLLSNREFESAERMFSAAMEIPEFRLPACEGVIQALVGAGRHAEAAATGATAVRIFARDADALLGIVYWHGVAAQALGDAETARNSFARVQATRHRGHFPDLAERLAAVQ